MKTLEEQAIAVIEKVRPYLVRDGGDVEFVAIKDGVVQVRMLGACAGCHKSPMTLDTIKEVLFEELDNIVDVVEVF